jgi:hypothetical protein
MDTISPKASVKLRHSSRRCGRQRGGGPSSPVELQRPSSEYDGAFDAGLGAGCLAARANQRTFKGAGPDLDIRYVAA